MVLLVYLLAASPEQVLPSSSGVLALLDAWTTGRNYSFKVSVHEGCIWLKASVLGTDPILKASLKVVF